MNTSKNAEIDKKQKEEEDVLTKKIDIIIKEKEGKKSENIYEFNKSKKEINNKEMEKKERFDKKEKNKLIEEKSKSLEKISFNKFRNNEPDIKIEKNINNKLITSKSYKNIEDIDNKNEKKENRKTWRFSIKNKDNDIDNKIEQLQKLKENENKILDTKQININTINYKYEKEKSGEENNKKKESLRREEDNLKIEKIKEKEFRTENYDKYNKIDTSYRININKTDIRDKYIKEKNESKDNIQNK